MRYLFFCLMIVFCCQVNAQKKFKFDTVPQLDTAKINRQMRALDSANTAAMDRMYNQHVTESQASMNNNLNAFVRMQQERSRKQMQQNYIRIGAGVLFLVILIIGWRRKKSQNNKQTNAGI